MECEQQTFLFSVRHARQQFTRAELLGLVAIGAYLWLLPVETVPDLATLALVAFGLLAVSHRDGLRPRSQPVDYLVILAVIAAAALSALVSADPARSLRFLVYVCLNMCLLLFASSMANRKTVWVIALCMGLFGILHLSALVVWGLIAGVDSAHSLISHTGLATLIVPNDALILGLCLPSLAFLFLDDDLRCHLLGCAVLAIYVTLSIYVGYLLQSKITLLSVLTALLVLAVLRTMHFRNQMFGKHRLTLIGGTFSLLLLLGASAWYLGNQSTTRLSLWSEAGTAHATLSEVLFGAGSNTFLYNPAAVESGFDKGDLVIPWVHNLYLEAYYDQGLFGLLCILALTSIPLLRALEIQDPRVRVMMLASIVTFCFVALFEVTLTRRFYFAFLAVFYGLCMAQTREVKNE